MHRIDRTSSIRHSAIEPSQIEEIEKKVQRTMVDTMLRVNVKREHRLTYYKKEANTGDVELSGMDARGLLSRGMLYPQDIYEKKKEETELISSYVRRQVFYLGMAPETHFSYINYEDASKKPTKELPFAFKIKDDVTPSRALDALEFQGLPEQKSEVGLSLFSCENVCEYAVLRGLQQVLGVEKFDGLFSSYSRTPLMLGTQNPYNPLNLLIDDRCIQSEEEIKEGDWIYVKNHWTYPFKHPYGWAQGQHAFCVYSEGEKKYVGFGLDAKGTTLLDLRRHLFDQFNTTPFEELLVTENLHENILRATGQGVALAVNLLGRDHLKETTLDPSTFLEKVARGEIGAIEMSHVKHLRSDRVALLQKLSVPLGKKQLMKWQKQLIDQFTNSSQRFVNIM